MSDTAAVMMPAWSDEQQTKSFKLFLQTELLNYAVAARTPGVNPYNAADPVIERIVEYVNAHQRT